FISGTLASRKTMQGQAQDLAGSWVAANDLNFSERYLDAVKRVKPAALQRVAREYLTTENRTIYALLPKGAAPKPSTATVQITEKAIQKFVLTNGLRLLVKEEHRLPFIEFRAVFKGGVLAETPVTNGITQLTAKMLLKGTKKRNAEQIATEIESLGGSIDSFGGNNSFGVSAEVLSSDFGKGLDLVADVLLNPTFPAPAFALSTATSKRNRSSRRPGMLLLDGNQSQMPRCRRRRQSANRSSAIPGSASPKAATKSRRCWPSAFRAPPFTTRTATLWS